MDLWIRSQKNEKLRPLLLKADEIEIGDYDDDMNCIVVNNLYCVGIYATKERALEVLDEIQTKIAKLSYQEHFIGKDFIGIESKVYEMPKE